MILASRIEQSFCRTTIRRLREQIVQSVDVWLNVPRRPLEASGTSGEKVAMNGGLNLSVLDGWWLEGYDGTNGFAIGGSVEGAEAGDVDASDAESLYRVLEQEVVPTLLRARYRRPAAKVDLDDEAIHCDSGSGIQQRPHGRRIREANIFLAVGL